MLSLFGWILQRQWLCHLFCMHTGRIFVTVRCAVYTLSYRDLLVLWSVCVYQLPHRPVLNRRHGVVHYMCSRDVFSLSRIVCVYQLP